MYKQRPYRHTITQVTEAGGTHLVILGTYSTLARAIEAARAADESRPDETREIRVGNWSYRNRYAHGAVKGWRA